MPSLTFVKFLSDLTNALDDNFRNINWGGCGVIAGLIGEEILKHTKHVRVAIAGYENASCIDNARKNLSNIKKKTPYHWYNENISFKHLWIEFKWRGIWYAIDTDENVLKIEYHPDQGEKQNGYMTVDEVIEVSSTGDGWNDRFDRSQIPEMRKLVKTEFQNYRNSKKRKSVNKVTKAA